MRCFRLHGWRPSIATPRKPPRVHKMPPSGNAKRRVQESPGESNIWSKKTKQSTNKPSLLHFRLHFRSHTLFPLLQSSSICEHVYWKQASLKHWQAALTFVSKTNRVLGGYWDIEIDSTDLQDGIQSSGYTQIDSDRLCLYPWALEWWLACLTLATALLFFLAIPE